MAEQQELVMYLNGQFLPHRKAIAALKDKDVDSAGGFYDSERTFNGEVFKLRAHLERLYRGLDYTKIDPGISLDDMENLTYQIMELNRPMLSPGEEFVLTQVVSLSPGRSPQQATDVNVVIYCRPLAFKEFAGSYVAGVRVVTPDTYSPPPPNPRSSPLGTAQRVIPLMTSREGSITECKGGNFMFVRDGRIKLPDRHNVLPGVSMQTVLELAESLGIEVDEDDYSTYDVYTSTEAFVSSTRNCMLPVATVNGLRLGKEVPGPVTRGILRAWQTLVGVDFIQQALDHLPPEDREMLQDHV